MSLTPDSPRTLVLGSNGQLGKALRVVLPQATFYTRTEVNFEDSASISSIDFGSFDYVINAAAYTSVDLAETPEGEERAWAINASSVKQIANECYEQNVCFVHISSDYVFNGDSSSPYRELDSHCALGVYGKTKTAGDFAAAKVLKHYIIRTSWVIGEGNNFVRTMASLAMRGKYPKVVDDQIGRLTFADDLAEGIAYLLKNGAPYGTYNITNEGLASSWADIAKSVFAILGSDPTRVKGVSTAEYFLGQDNIAPRPLNSMLDLAKIESLGFTPSAWDYKLKKYLEKLL